MSCLPKLAWTPILAATLVALLFPATLSAQNAQIRQVAVTKTGGSTEITIETSQRVMPMTQVITAPDRLVIDFPDALPGPLLRPLTVNDGPIKTIRAALLSANPPMTRIVIDLNSAQDFRLVPSSKSVVVKLLGGGVTSAAASPKEPVPAPNAAEPEPAPVPRASTPVAPSVAAVAPKPRVPAKIAPEPAPVRPIRTATLVVPSIAPAPSQRAQIRHVAVLKSGGATEIEIETSQRVVPETQVITGPDRVVIDFPEAVPGPLLRALVVNQGEVKGVRVGLLSANPTVTRVVLDLKSPQDFQLFSSGKSVIVKLSGGRGVSAAAGAAAPPPIVPEAAPAPPPEPITKVRILFEDGLLSLTSTKGSLADVLNEIRLQTGADIAVPAGADREEVAVSLGPASPREVVAQLLNGSRYNFIIVGSPSDPNKVDRVILSPKGAGEMSAQSQPPREEPVPVAQMTPLAGSVGPSAPAPAPSTVPPVDDAQPQGESLPPDTAPQPGDPQPAPN